jgi:hypothetical protein
VEGTSIKKNNREMGKNAQFISSPLATILSKTVPEVSYTSGISPI